MLSLGSVARIPEPSRPGLFTRFVYLMTKRQLGRVVLPVKVGAHSPKLLWGCGQMEMSIQGTHSIDETLKLLAGIKTVMIVGCPFRIDVGSAVGGKAGVSRQKTNALADFRNLARLYGS